MGCDKDGEVAVLRGYDKVHLKLGSHGLFLIKASEQWPETIYRLVKAGLQHREICAIFSSSERISSFSAFFKKEGNSLEASLERKELQLFPFKKTKPNAESLFQSLYASLQQLVLDAHQARLQGVRAIVDMSWYLSEASASKLLDFEHEMEELLASREFPLTLICTYDLKKVEGLLTIELLDLHSHVIIGSVEEEPPFFLRVATRLFKDPLTRLHNVRYLHERLEEEMDRTKRYDGQFSLLLADLNGFQALNDKFGYIRGDRILVEVAKVLKDTVRKVDLVCRYGDGAFILLLPETSREGAQVISQRLQEAARKIKLKDAELSLSIGTVTYPDEAKTKEALFQKAAKSLKAAKQHRHPKATVS